MPSPTRRTRRRPEDAKVLILDAAEASIAADGPAGLRLAEVAARAGVSHPTILHHFGSREGLVRALNLRALEQLKTGLIAGMATQNSDDGITRTFAAYRDGLAQRMLWLIQAGDALPANRASMIEEIVQSLHAVRLRIAAPGRTVDIEDSRAVVHLTAISAFGDAVIGPRLRQLSGGEEGAARARFESWFAALIALHIRSQR